MNALIRRITFLVVLPLLLAIVGLALPAFAQSTDDKDDPFYGQQGTAQIIEERRIAPFQQVEESVDPFTGNVNLLHTDVILPGNAGLDLRIQRSYNSRIWGLKSGQFPRLVAYYEASVMGLGWSFHFGRVVNPFGSGSSNRFLPNNPVVEMPDGSSHPLFQDKNDFNRMISREYWIYKQISNGVFQLKLTDGTIYTFPSTNAYFPETGVTVHQVSTIQTPNGNTITFTYDPNDKRKVTSITDTVGRNTITFTYQVLPRPGCASPGGWDTTALTSITVNGKVFTYSYQTIDCYFFLTRATPPVGPSWNYTYIIAPCCGPPQYQLQTVTYPSGAVLTYGYSNVRFDIGPDSLLYSVVSSRALSGRGVTATTWTYSYDANSPSDQITTVTQSGCKTEKFTFKSFGSLPNQGLVNGLWRVGRLLKKEILDGATVVQTETYTWSPSASISLDDIGNVNYNNMGAFLYDDQIFVPLLSSKSVTRDGKTYTTSFSNFNAYGDSGTITENGDASRTTTLTYYTDAVKNIVKGYPLSQAVTVGGQTFTTNYSYDANGNLTTLNRYGVVTTFGYTNGNVSSRTNARNFTTNYQYSNGTVSQIAKPITGYTINRLINWEGTIARETNGRGFITTFSYDALNRVTVIDPPLEVNTTMTYDNTGATFWKVTKGSAFTQFNVDGLARVTSTAAVGGINTAATYNVCGQKNYQSYPYTTSNIGDNFTYDRLDRVTQVTHPDGKTQTYSYANGNVAITNERTITVTYGYQSFGDPDEKRLVSVADAAGTTTYAYNAVESLTTITHPGPLTRSFSYNTKNFLISETHPETGTLTYGRDNVGNLTSQTDGKGATSFAYDALDRRTSIDYPGTADDTTFAYDNADNRTSVSNAAAAYTSTYDSENRLTQQVLTINGLTFTTSFGYDTQGNLTTLTYPTGRAITYTYDSANRVSGLNGYVSSVTYHPSRAMASLTFANAKTTTIGYDNRYRVQATDTPAVLQYTYGYDGVSNVLSITDILDASRTRTMTYDNVDRLLTASGIWGSMSFAYDAVGNRTSKTTASGTTTYSYASNRVTAATGAETDQYAYDPNGNMTTIRGFTLAHDVANRLIEVNAGTVTYTYDGDGRRVKKVNNAAVKTTLYHYDRAGNILAETDGAGATQVEYLYINGQHVAKIVPGTPESVLYYHNDTLASPVAMTDTAGNVVWRVDYEPFGNLAAIMETVPNTHEFIGKERDPETGLHYFGARYYDDGIGRFLSVDPALRIRTPSASLTHTQLLNNYAYAGNNPYRFVDRDGNFIQLAPIVVGILSTVLFPSAVNAPVITDALENAQNSFEFALETALLQAGIGANRLIAGGAEKAVKPARGLSESAADSVTSVAPRAENARLQGVINQLFRPTDKVPGGTAGAIREEIRTGKPVGGTFHRTKGEERARQLEKIIQEEKLSSADRATAQEMLKDLGDALGGQ
jgi:RHS repeat-associated protein